MKKPIKENKVDDMFDDIRTGTGWASYDYILNAPHSPLSNTEKIKLMIKLAKAGILVDSDKVNGNAKDKNQIPSKSFMSLQDLERKFKGRTSPNNEIMEDKVSGGLADKLTLQDIANKHKVDIDELTKEYQKGIKVELEHTSDRSVAEEIARDHLFEDPKYYTKLATIENESINESKYKPSQVQQAVDKVKKQLINKWKTKGAYENFGQKELRALQDKFEDVSDYSDDMRKIRKILMKFDDWAMNYTGTNESKNINEDTKGDAEWIYDKYIKNSKINPTASSIAHDIRMDDGKIAASYIKHVLKKHKNIDIPLTKTVNEVSTLGLSGIKSFAKKHGYGVKTTSTHNNDRVTLSKDGKECGTFDPSITTKDFLYKKLNINESINIKDYEPVHGNYGFNKLAKMADTKNTIKISKNEFNDALKLLKSTGTDILKKTNTEEYYTIYSLGNDYNLVRLQMKNEAKEPKGYYNSYARKKPTDKQPTAYLKSDTFDVAETFKDKHEKSGHYVTIEYVWNGKPLRIAYQTDSDKLKKESIDESKKIGDEVKTIKGKSLGIIVKQDKSSKTKKIVRLLKLDNKYKIQVGNIVYDVETSNPEKEYNTYLNESINEDVKDQLMSGGMKTWWKYDKKDVMSFIYWLQRQIPPSGPKFDAEWKKIAAQLQKKHPAPKDEYEKIINEVINEATNRYDIIVRKYETGKLKGFFGAFFVSDKAKKQAEFSGFTTLDKKGNPVFGDKISNFDKFLIYARARRLSCDIYTINGVYSYNDGVAESINERKEFPSKEELIAYMVKGGHNKNSAKRVVDANYEYVKKHYQGSGLPKISDVLWTVESVDEAAHGYKTSDSSYINDHNDEYKLAKSIIKKVGTDEIKFYDELEVLHDKLGHPKYMKWISNALRGYHVDMYKDPKIKNKAEAEEALYLLSK